MVPIPSPTIELLARQNTQLAMGKFTLQAQDLDCDFGLFVDRDRIYDLSTRSPHGQIINTIEQNPTNKNFTCKQKHTKI